MISITGPKMYLAWKDSHYCFGKKILKSWKSQCFSNTDDSYSFHQDNNLTYSIVATLDCRKFHDLLEKTIYSAVKICTPNKQI